jgi:Domain of unknown function (DUF5916)
MPLLPAVAAATLLAAAGPVYQGTERNVRVELPRLDAAVIVDGHLSEPAWQQAATLTGFSQYAPDDGRAAVDETEVLVWYSPTAIHFGIRAHASPGTVRATLADRDRIENDDWIQIFLSTFDDGRQASVFGVNPLGVQLDGAVIENTGAQGSGFGGLAGGRTLPDLSPDFVFDSKGRLTDYGYEVEVRIPFKSLRYQSAPVQNWGLHVIRRIQSSGHEDSWVPARRSAASFLGQSGTLLGLTDLRRGLVMDLNPVVTSHVDGSESGDRWSYDAHRPEPGGNLRWGLTPNLTLNATLNPDFSQVEADATQFQIDPRQALFFPEKRPFFLDGIEFFSTPNNLVYSRRIVEPLAAAKVTGKVGSTTIAALSAVDGEAQSSDTTSHPLFNIVRVQHDLGAASRGAVLYTSRVDGSSSNQVASADAHLVRRKIYAVDFQAATSRTVSNGRTLTGPLWQASVSRSGRRFGLQYVVKGISPDFRTDSGFIGRGNVAIANITNQISLYGRPGAVIEKWTGDVLVNGVWRYDDFTAGRAALERKFHVNSNFSLRGGWHAGFSTLIERFDYDSSLYPNYRLLQNGELLPFVGTPHLPNLDYVLTIDAPPVHGLSANVFYIWGRDENFLEWASANIVYAEFAVQWRPTQRLRIDGNYNLQSFARRTDGSYTAIRRVPRLKLEYQATRAVFFRYVGEFASSYQDDLRDDSRTDLPIVLVSPNGSYSLAARFSERSVRNDWLFSYQPTPGTVIFAGYGNTLADGFSRDPRELRRTRDGFFLKVSYLFRL